MSSRTVSSSKRDALPHAASDPLHIHIRNLRTTPSASALHARINSTSVDYPAYTRIDRLFERWADQCGNNIALIQDSRILSYAEVNSLANCLAGRLSAHGALPNWVIAVDLPRSPELIIAFLAILKSGAAYLPLDRTWPSHRLQQVLTLARCRLIITHRPCSNRDEFGDYQFVIPRWDIPTHIRNNHHALSSRQVAYINFTSGSSGVPKGVPIEHRSVVNLVSTPRYTPLDSGTRLLHLAPNTFDAATFEIWGPLLNGGTCVLYPNRSLRLTELGRLASTHGVTTIFLTTALFNIVVDEGLGPLRAIRHVLTGGETYSHRHMTNAFRACGSTRFVHVYGPTECTTFSTFHVLTKAPRRMVPVPIGQPIQNARLYVIHKDRLCEPGEVGEIHIAGPGLSPGYLHEGHHGEMRFFELCVDDRQERVYRTGDHGYLLDDGDLIFSGRQDDQVKLHGFRIELGEISSCLNAYPGIKQSIVMIDRAVAERPRLVAFIVPKDESCLVGPIDAYLRSRLPVFMIPSVIRMCASFPLTANGKIDRKRLLGAIAVTASGNHYP